MYNMSCPVIGSQLKAKFLCIKNFRRGNNLKDRLHATTLLGSRVYIMVGSAVLWITWEQSSVNVADHNIYDAYGSLLSTVCRAHEAVITFGASALVSSWSNFGQSSCRSNRIHGMLMIS